MIGCVWQVFEHAAGRYTMFYFMDVLLRLPTPNTITANSIHPLGSNKKVELWLQRSITAMTPELLH